MKYLRHITSSLALIIFVVACTSVLAPEPLEPAVQMTDKEFAEEVVLPVLQLMKTISAFYAENHKIPADRETLATFAAKNSEPIRWECFSRFEMSNNSEESVLYLSIRSPSSLSETGEISTSWRLSLSETTPNMNKLKFSISPESSFCLSPSPGLSAPRDRTKIELFLDFLYRPAQSSAQNAPLCFKYSERKPSRSNDKLKEKLKDEMRRKQLQQSTTSS